MCGFSCSLDRPGPAILGLLPETATTDGAILLSGRNVLTASEQKLRQMRGSDVSMVFQEPSTALNPVFTVGWQIAEGLRARRSSSSPTTWASSPTSPTGWP